jgi:hypothetical protein
VTLFVVLYRNRNRLALRKVQLAYSLLYEAYDRRLWWMELLDLLEKACITPFLASTTSSTITNPPPPLTADRLFSLVFCCLVISSCSLQFSSSLLRRCSARRVW